MTKKKKTAEQFQPLIEYRGEKEAWIYLPSERTEIYLTDGKQLRHITL